jgi:hypothetical protein
VQLRHSLRMTPIGRGVSERGSVHFRTRASRREQFPPLKVVVGRAHRTIIAVGLFTHLQTRANPIMILEGRTESVNMTNWLRLAAALRFSAVSQFMQQMVHQKLN